jgi:hypothetical protein
VHITATNAPFMNDQPQKQKLYCYVDESGQDTEGRFFLVAVVIAGNSRDELQRKLEEIEHRTKKGRVKWHRTGLSRRLDYIRSILDLPELAGALYFAQYANSKAYLDLTVDAIAGVIERQPAYDRLSVIVDGLQPGEIAKFKLRLNERRVHARKIVGVRDESDPLIRLADAVAGFVRDALEGKPDIRSVYDYALRAGKIVEQKKNPHG